MGVVTYVLAIPAPVLARAYLMRNSFRAVFPQSKFRTSWELVIRAGGENINAPQKLMVQSITA